MGQPCSRCARPAALPLRLALATSLLAATALTAWAGPAAPSPEAAIRKVLDEQVAAWNRHDLEGYMAGYWKSPELRFFAGDKVTLGWQETLDRYRKRYQSEGREMGTLDMRDVEVRVLSPTHAFVRGRWHLKFSDGKEAGGLYTLLVERKPEGWRIVHDHSS